MKSYRTSNFDAKLVSLLRGGAVGFMPSDTIYGLSCSALNQEAVERIYELKGREPDKPFIILISDVGQASNLGIDSSRLKPAAKLWPAPLSVVCPVKETPRFLHRGTHSLALRIPDDEPLRRLIAKTGPLVSTSPNPAGRPPITDAGQAGRVFGGQLDFYVDKGPLSGQPSTVAKLEGGQLSVIRSGAFRVE